MKNEVVKINVENFKGIVNIKEKLNFKNHSSILIYSPNGVGKTSLINSFKKENQGSSEDVKNKKKHPITKEITKTQTESDYEFIIFDSLKTSELDYGTFSLNSNIKNKTKIEDSIKKIETTIKSNSILSTIKESHGNKDYESLIDMINKEASFDLSLIKDKENVYVTLFSKKSKDLLNDEHFNELMFYIKDYKEILGNNPSLKAIEGLINAEALMANPDYRDQGVLDKIKQAKADKKEFYRKYKNIETNYSNNKILKNKEIMNFLHDDITFFDKINISTVKKLKDMKESLEILFLKQNENVLNKLKLSIEEYKAFKENEDKLKTKWDLINKQYNFIFPNSPIKFELKKAKDKYIKNYTYQVCFYIKKPNETKEYKDVKEPFLWKELSESEKRSLYLFHIIHKIDFIDKKTQIIVFDDIIDSFDEINQSSFIYYLKTLEDKSIKFLLLTHNYAFYKTLYNKLENSFRQIMVRKKYDLVFIEDKDSLDYIFKDWFCNDKLKISKKTLIATIAVSRELNNLFPKGKSTTLNDILLKMLHYKNENINIKDYISEIEGFIVDFNKDDFVSYNSYNYLELLKEVCDNIIESQSEKNISEMIIDKLCLAIGIRVFLELKIINFLGNDSINDISSNQTKRLIEKLNNKLVKNNKEKLDLIKYDISTSNIIHLNSLNYEVIFYYDVELLKIFYKEITNLVI
tara:strand:- start:1465 stop:3540 length:2076 start_codon:yes stop_codon:yes gene_type:complete